MKQHAPVSASTAKGTFATIFPSSSFRTASDGRLCWRIRGSGVSQRPERAHWTGAVVTLLESHGIVVDRAGSSSFGGADSYRVSARFLDGELSAETGNYIGGSRGAFVYGARAALFIALGLELRVGKALFTKLGLAPTTFASLCEELAKASPPQP